MFKKLTELRNEWSKKGEMYFSIGRDIFNYGRDLIKERISNSKSEEESQTSSSSEPSGLENLQKKFSVQDPNNSEINAKLKSLDDHKHIINQRGQNEWANANMAHRNFDNHQGN